MFKKKLFGQSRITAVFEVFKKQIDELNTGISEVDGEINSNTEELAERRTAFEMFEQTILSVNNKLNNSKSQAVNLVTNLKNLITSAEETKPKPDLEFSKVPIEELETEEEVIVVEEEEEEEK